MSVAIDKFLNVMQNLSAHPGEAIWQNQAVSEAEAMAGRFRTLGEFLNMLETQIRLEVANIVESINILTSQIAQLNGKISTIELVGGQAHNLSDQRDQRILELSELIGVQTQNRDNGIVNVNADSIPLVMVTSISELEISLDENSNLGISIAGTSRSITNVVGGKIGGLLALKNELVYDVRNDLNSLADAIIQQTNQYHVQGVGSAGSFTQLTGWTMSDEDLSDFTADVTDGDIYIRVTDTSSSTITRNKITIDGFDDIRDF